MFISPPRRPGVLLRTIYAKTTDLFNGPFGVWRRIFAFIKKLEITPVGPDSRKTVVPQAQNPPPA
jgi:hypothetical protein